jgi:NADP oxidoreductase coenzyme F420-dependent
MALPEQVLELYDHSTAATPVDAPWVPLPAEAAGDEVIMSQHSTSNHNLVVADGMTLGVIGAGVMGQTLIRGLIASGVVSKDQIWAGELLGPARPYCERLKDLGVLCKETHDQVIRLGPPLIVAREDLAWLMAQVRAAFGGPQ